MGESGQTPWALIWNNPLILAGMISDILYWFFLLFSMRYVGVSIQAALGGASGVFYFLGLIVVFLVTGKLSTVGVMIHPVRLILICSVLLFTILLPNVEVISLKRKGKGLSEAKNERSRMVIGILILFLALAFEALDSIIVTYIFDESALGLVDYMMSSYIASILPILFFSVILRIKNQNWYIPFKNGGKILPCYAVTTMFSGMLYMVASSFDAVRTGIFFIAYPIVPIIGAGIFLKEKYTWRQNLCIWIITGLSLLYCVLDYVTG